MNAPDLLVGIAAYGLPGRAGRLTTRPLEPFELDALLDQVVEHHLSGHLLTAVDAGDVVVTAAQRTEVMHAHHRALAFDLLLERRLVETCALFVESDVAYRVLKGPAFAHTVYPEPHLRSYGDIDVLVGGADYDRALALLATRGAQARYREPRPGFSSRFGKGVCVVDGDIEIDVHRTFASGPFGIALDPLDLFGSAQSFEVAGEPLLALAVEAQFLHACYHVALGSYRPGLVAMRDVAQMLLTTPLDCDAALETAQRWHGRAVVQRAIRCTWDNLGLDVDHPLSDWTASYEADAFERRSLDAYVTEQRSYARQAMAGLRAVRGVRAQLAYATAMLFPSRSYARERDGYVARWRRAAVLAREKAGT
jgi:hypothetical protein